ncbi:MAG: helicase-related protein [Candidatus Helarchaeota archaeon]
MNNTNDYLARDIFQARIKKGLLGPGSDIFVYDDNVNDEIISDYPLQRYYTGILFPEKEKIKTFSDLSDSEIENETIENDEENNAENNFNEEKDNFTDDELSVNKNKDEDDELKITQNTFFPSNIGLTFCLDKNVKELNVEFSFGLYSQIEKDIKIQVSKDIFDEFINHSTFPFKELIRYENGYMILSRKLKGKSRTPRSEEFKILDNFKKSDAFKDSSLKYKFHYFEKLIGRTWKRENKIIPQKISVKDEIIPKQIFEKNITKTKENFLRVSYTVKTYQIENNPNNIYVKILLINSSDRHPANKYSNSNEILNAKSLFQSKIKINSVFLHPYKSYIELNPLDKEAEILNYLYKDTFSYGIGHNCSVEWNEKHTEIETTFIPQYDVKDTKNSFSEEDFTENHKDFITLNKSIDIYNLSYFSKDSKKQIIDKLKSFVEIYGHWIEKQKQKKSVNKEIEKRIFNNLDYNYNRLIKNINLLNDDNIFTAFQLANTAMLIQIIISNDVDFSGNEKEIIEINSNINYKSLDYFMNYEFNKLPFGRPKYRPFQLAFFILNLDSITDINSESRNKVVDLIWFPTGGGKTEAYLAVAAFTIIYRRIVNNSGYEGTSVIMRYTLRLLTAQQFERASRLIVSLEFLRNFFPKKMKDEPITIGMWVGMASTPNTLKEAVEKVEEINSECNKEKGNPENKNVFQISSCPWCGTKLISKNQYDNWDYGFKIEGKGKNIEFKIKCLNEHCHFHKVLPVQVVDEMLYENPPTLLFGTVDKFAMLSWKADGHRFFNSLNDDKLPPDLIIQDELHLLSGPLGSITGIYESVIEILCTKKGKKPKIISSTATTRNTDEQIKALYGINRKVNIFPPAGLSYDDSFFAKIDNSESRRRYIGLIPSGKSSIDIQLQVIANLFVARLEAFKALVINGNKDYETFDKYWTIISYYNSLKDVGRIHNKVGDEISNFTSTLQIRLFGDQPNYKFNYRRLYDRDVELTSRVDSSKIKQTLKLLEENRFTANTIKINENDDTYVSNIIDLVLATNMISVGIDIDRFNIILINGQPKNIAEYIQASSRVGRKYKGLAIALLDGNRARDKSHFEHFIPFHQAFYKSVEPISLTPFTENTIKKMLTSIMVTYVRHKIPGMSQNDAAQYFQPEMLDGLKVEIKERYKNSPNTYTFVESKLQELSDDWLYKINELGLKNYESSKKEIGLLVKPTEKNFGEEEIWSVMQSMREIDTNSFIKVDFPKERRNV